MFAQVALLNPIILVTNDDGVRSPGLERLARELDELGDVFIVAPEEEKSAVSHALTIHEPVWAREVSDQVFAVRGTPADCVIVAVRKILKEPPDLVVSGINHGANIGDDVMYSGTVAGAREACYLDLPAFAISQFYHHAEIDFTVAGRFARRLARRILREGLPAGTFLNVNVPENPSGGARFTRQGSRLSKSSIQENFDPRGRKYYWIGEDRSGWKGRPNSNSDYEAVREGYISVTPLHRDQTNHRALKEMRESSILSNAELTAVSNE